MSWKSFVSSSEKARKIQKRVPTFIEQIALSSLRHCSHFTKFPINTRLALSHVDPSLIRRFHWPTCAHAVLFFIAPFVLRSPVNSDLRSPSRDRFFNRALFAAPRRTVLRDTPIISTRMQSDESISRQIYTPGTLCTRRRVHESIVEIVLVPV